MNQHHLYLGKAGQAYVMSQFLVRGWNVAVPEVDIGDDLFVVRDAVGEFSRIQVKTSNIIERKGGYSAQFSLPIPQLERSTFPELTYCFVLHAENDWQGTVVISRKALLRLYDFSEIGSQPKMRKATPQAFELRQIATCRTRQLRTRQTQ